MCCNNASPTGNDSRKYCSYFQIQSYHSTVLSTHRTNRTAWLLAPSVICRHQEGELLSKCFHMKLQMLPIALQCKPCPALRSCQRWWIRRHYMSCSFAPAPGHRVNHSSHHSKKKTQFAARRWNLFQSNGSQQTSLSKHWKVLPAISI